MPTAARLIAAILFAALGWYASELFKPLLEEGTDTGRLSEINALVGVFVGWKIAGPRAGDTYGAAVGYGLSAGAGLVVLSLFVHSSTEMLNRALRKSYDGATEAVVAVFELMVEYGALMADSKLITTLIGGSVIAGVTTEWVGRRYS